MICISFNIIVYEYSGRAALPGGPSWILHMPTVRVELSPGRSAEQKTRYMQEVTRLTVEILKCPVESVDVIFIEIPPTEWAHGGKFYAQPPA
ncbi:4-oxalocrotonate tautomerase [Bordetella pertussis]|nr:4-oxalocrotonate tautomerase [Bordetella pertussis]VTQ96340.1 4-oxalocrotonate tautomerase [Bordetella bronchiseptica]CFD92109.1 4-oxalocrotonate tautomerase [Bordetella pertussis]CFE02274.1 4-oxalocrotonate tautomerase [Bordetella pertussis]CFL80131.1 4-oxalocrotonate tautomerase [Bordetella pertussis]